MSNELLSKLFDGGATATPAPAATDGDQRDLAPSASEEQGGTAQPKADNDQAEPTADAKPKKDDGNAKSDGATADQPSDDLPDEDDASLSDEQRGQLRALKAERAKRQDWKEKAIRGDEENRHLREQNASLLDRLDRLERRLSGGGEAAAGDTDAGEEPSTETPAEYYENPARFTEETVRRLVSEEKAAAERDRRLNLWKTSSAAAREKHDNFDEIEAAFKAEAEANPYLLSHFLKSDDPGEFVVNYVTKVKPALEGGTATTAPPIDEEALRKKIRAELEQEQRDQAAKAAADQMPTTQAGARGSGTKPGRLPASGEQLVGRLFDGR